MKPNLSQIWRNSIPLNLSQIWLIFWFHIPPSLPKGVLRSSTSLFDKSPAARMTLFAKSRAFRRPFRELNSRGTQSIYMKCPYLKIFLAVRSDIFFCKIQSIPETFQNLLNLVPLSQQYEIFPK